MMAHNVIDAQTADRCITGALSTLQKPNLQKSGTSTRLENHRLKAFLVVVTCAMAGTVVMHFLGAYEKLFTFGRAYADYGFVEMAVFLPAFLSLGLLLFA